MPAKYPVFPSMLNKVPEVLANDSEGTVVVVAPGVVVLRVALVDNVVLVGELVVATET